MKHSLLILSILFAGTIASAYADTPRALPAGTLPSDSRLQALKDLNGYFPFTVPKSKEEWEKRAEYVRRQVLISQGLWPMPTKNPLNAVIHGKIDKPEYTIEKVYFESAPGFFVTGNLYRPKNVKGKVPGIMFAHGHWQNARLSLESMPNLLREISTGEERFIEGGRSRFQSMCVQLARMGCVAWQWDMLSDSDSHQFSRTTVHGFAKQRPEMNTTENWGLYSPQAEAHLQSIMGLQTLNAVRSMDFLLSLPEVDPERTAITGASGGGTQTMLLAAIDPRVKLSFPAVMVSTSMQGGCTCENASLLRVNTGNIEFAALFAPKPQGMTAANDWTKEMSTKGFPELQQLYTLLGAPKNVMLQHGEHFPHNYNAVARSAFYTWINQHFNLGLNSPVAKRDYEVVEPKQLPVVERDYEVVEPKQLSVWDAEHPEPKSDDPEFERSLLKWLTKDANKQLLASADSVEHLHQTVGLAVDVLIGRTYEKAGEVEWDRKNKQDHDGYLVTSGLLRNKTYKEELPVTWLYPKDWNGKAVVWLDDSGKSSLYNADGTVKAEVLKLVKSGATVVGADLLYQGEFLKDGQPLKRTRTVENPREFAGYTAGYNHSLFAQRTHDVLTIIKYLRTAQEGSHPKPSSVDVIGFGGTGPIVAAARALAGDAINRAAIDTNGFRFGKLLDYRDPQFLPGGAKYLDVPGLLALGAPHAVWVAGEGAEPVLVTGLYKAAGKPEQLTAFSGEPANKAAAAVEWLLK